MCVCLFGPLCEGVDVCVVYGPDLCVCVCGCCVVSTRRKYTSTELP